MSEFKYQINGEIKVKESLEQWILRIYDISSLDYFSPSLQSDFYKRLKILKIRPFKNKSGHNYNYFTNLNFTDSPDLIIDSKQFKYVITTNETGKAIQGNAIRFNELYIVNENENTIESYNNNLKTIDSEIQRKFQEIENLKKETEVINELITFMKERNIKELDKEEYQIWKKLNSFGKQVEIILEAEEAEIKSHKKGISSDLEF